MELLLLLLMLLLFKCSWRAAWTVSVRGEFSARSELLRRLLLLLLLTATSILVEDNIFAGMCLMTILSDRRNTTKTRLSEGNRICRARRKIVWNLLLLLLLLLLLTLFSFAVLFLIWHRVWRELVVVVVDSGCCLCLGGVGLRFEDAG